MRHGSPYADLPPHFFWRTGVAQQSPLCPQNIYSKKFAINKATKIVTAGSCFAQHITHNLKVHGYSIVDTEPAPEYLPKNEHTRYGYSMYSARFGNIYTMRQLLQLAQEAFGIRIPAEIVWENDGAYYDALRPNVEPEGLSSPDEVLLHRAHHIKRVREAFISAEVLIFTLGLTEAWVHTESGTVFPTAPGAITGTFCSEKYAFKNFQFSEIISDFNLLKKLIHERQAKDRKTKFILTVSPVPLTATYSGEHVLCATIYSKSVLRAVAGQVYKNQKDVDYFPSFEIISNCWNRGIFYENNMRSISKDGVSIAMSAFLNEHLIKGEEENPAINHQASDKKTQFDSAQFEDVVCEEALLEEFGR